MMEITRRSAIFAACCAAAVTGAETLRPQTHLAQQRQPVDLEQQVPRTFGSWSEVKGAIPVLPDPEVQAKLDALYTQVLARTYVNDRGQRVMLSIAYGSDQSSEATAAHRPEFCYSAQGFQLADRGRSQLQIGDRLLTVQKLIARQGGRIEPLMYWVTLDTQATLPGLGRKLEQLRHGLRGEIADGMLVRVSSTNLSAESTEYDLQRSYLLDLADAMDGTVRQHYFGARST